MKMSMTKMSMRTMKMSMHTTMMSTPTKTKTSMRTTMMTTRMRTKTRCTKTKMSMRMKTMMTTRMKHDDEHAHEHEHEHGEMHSHCDEHDAELASLVEEHHGMDSEVTDLSPWSGEWKSNWSFSQAELQAGYDAILAATPELTQDLLSQFIEAANYTPFSQITFDGGSVAFDGTACDYRLSDQSSIPESLGEVSLFETEDEACGETRFLLLAMPYGSHEDGTFHFHMRIGASFDEVTDEQSLSFPSIFMDSIDSTIINTMYTAFARAIGIHIATTYGVEFAMSEAEMEAMSVADSGEEDEHAHEEDEHAHGPACAFRLRLAGSAGRYRLRRA